MELLQLKVPPDRARLIADAVDYYITHGDYTEGRTELEEIATWLRYRLAIWDNRHPPAATG